MAIIMCLFLIAVPPLAGLYAFIGMMLSPKNWRKYLPFYILMMFVLCYSYHPTHEIDLTRYFEMVREIGKVKGLGNVINYGTDGLFVRNIFFWLVAKTGDYDLLQAISTTTVYAIAAYITCSSAEDYRAERLIPALFLLQIALLQYCSLLSNVRNVFAFSLIILAAYLDLVKKKRSIGVILLYILPCFIHLSGVVLVGLRLMLPLLRKNKVLTVIAVIFAPFMIRFLYNNVGLFDFGGSIGFLLRSAIYKAYSYWDTTTGLNAYEKALLASRYEAASRFFMMTFSMLIMILIYLQGKRTQTDKPLESFIAFVFLIGIMVLVCNVFIAPNYWRFYSAVVVACPVAIYPLLSDRKKLSLVLQILLCGLIFYALGGLTMNVRESFSQFDFSDWLKGIMINNPYVIVIKMIINLVK